MVFISQEKIFYGVSAFFGVLAIFYFGFEYLVALSPFTISVMLFSVFLAFLGLGLNRKGNTAVLAYIFSAGAYTVGLFYTMSQFTFGIDPVLLSFIISSIVFAGLGYLITQRELKLENKQFKYGIIALTLIVGGLVAYDTVSGDVTHSYSLYEEAELEENMVIGEVTTNKDGWLPRKSTGVNFQACIYNETDERVVYNSGFSSSVDTMQFRPVEESQDIELEIRRIEELGVEGTLPVVSTDREIRCPDSADEPGIMVSARSGEPVQKVNE